MRQPNFILPAFCVFFLLFFSACIPDVNEVTPAPDEENIYTNAYLISEDSDLPGNKAFHMVFTTKPVHEGGKLTGSSRTARFSYSHPEQLPAGTYDYETGQSDGTGPIRFDEMDFFEQKNFRTNAGSAYLSPSKATITVDYVGTETVVRIESVRNGREIVLADFRGQVHQITLNEWRTDMSLPTPDDKNEIKIGETEVPVNHAYLLVPPVSNVQDLCLGAIVLTQDDVTGPTFMEGESNALVIMFSGPIDQMGNGYRSIASNEHDYLSQYNLSYDNGGFYENLNFPEFETTESIVGQKGEGLFYVDGNVLVVRFKIEGANGKTITATYSGPIDRYDFD